VTISVPAFDWRSRSKAALIHFVANAGVGLAVALVVFGMWYRWPYRTLSGGTALFGLVVGIDIVLGPVITFIVFDRRKPWPELVRDLSIVVILQLAALIYGLYVTFMARPVALAFEENRFRVVSAAAVMESELPQAPEDMRSLSLTGPRVISTAMPTDPKEKEDAVTLALKGYDIGTRPSLWRPWDANARRAAVASAKPLADLARRHPSNRHDFDAALARTQRSMADLVYVPMVTARGGWVALLDRASGDVLDYIPVSGF
jgi:hypothetical protein